MKDVSLVIFSAGQGTRMKSSLPKALHPVGGKPMLARMLAAAQAGGITSLFVVTKYAEHLLLPIIRAYQATACTQIDDKPGTAGCLMSVPLDQLQPYTCITNADHPLMTGKKFQNFYKQALETEADIVIGACEVSDPKNYGRIVKEGQQVTGIIESYDFTDEIRSINEINTGLMLIRTSVLKKNLHFITNDNPKNEYPITDLISICAQQNLQVRSIPVPLPIAAGVNTQEELALANNYLCNQKIEELMNQGVIIPFPDQVYIEEDVQVEQGSIIYPGTYLKGRTHIGSYCAIEPNCFIFDSEIDHYVYIKSHSYLEKAKVESKSVIGPFAHLRPDSHIGQECKIGNFAEVKNSKIGDNSKASHMCYIGDSTIGKNVNIGCGTVTCNYAPNKKKHSTTIHDHAFIGSGSMLVAPLDIGENTIVGAGSVITKNIPKDHLALTRAEEKQHPHRSSNSKKKN